MASEADPEPAPVLAALQQHHVDGAPSVLSRLVRWGMIPLANKSCADHNASQIWHTHCSHATAEAPMHAHVLADGLGAHFLVEQLAGPAARQLPAPHAVRAQTADNAQGVTPWCLRQHPTMQHPRSAVRARGHGVESTHISSILL